MKILLSSLSCGLRAYISRHVGRPSSYGKGILSEEIAAWYLRLKGYKILARRYKTRGGEIDIIALRGCVLAMVEVKTRAGTDQAIQSIHAHNRTRIANAARHFLASPQGTHALARKQNKITVRFDAVLLAPPLGLRHLDNAWEIPT